MQRIGSVTSTSLSIKSEEEAKPNTLSAKFGAGKFPHHTDFAFRPYPPRIIVLINETNQTYKRPTAITRFVDLPTQMLELHARTMWNLKTKAGSFVVGGVTAIGSHTIRRWDVQFLTPHNWAAHLAVEKLRVAFPTLEKLHEWEAHSAILIDNWNCTHSRGENQQGDDQHRRLVRLEAWHHAGMDN